MGREKAGVTYMDGGEMIRRKRKSNNDDYSRPNKSSKTNGHTDPDTSKPTALFKPRTPRKNTLSIAVPGSIIANAKNHDQKTFLCGQIARALAVFNVDEVVVFNDEPPKTTGKATDDEGYTAMSDPCHFLAHVLTYLETPAHLRKTLFPMHPNLRTAGTLPSLDMPHHSRSNEWCEYREGATANATSEGTYVDVGLNEQCLVKGVKIPPKTRVTIKLDEEGEQGSAVAPTTPREEGGYYWGYTIRRSESLSGVLTECPFDGGYDLSFGTSERGKALSDVLTKTVPKYKHMLVVFGGVAGLETAARNDPELVDRGIKGENVGDLFDFWTNLLPDQGSRTIRTEEAVWLGLMGLRGVAQENGVG